MLLKQYSVHITVIICVIFLQSVFTVITLVTTMYSFPCCYKLLAFDVLFHDVNENAELKVADIDSTC